MYAKGGSEELIGRILSDKPGLRAKLSLATKANPFSGFDGSLSVESVTHQLQASLDALGTSQVAIFYLHAPDHATSLDETLGAVQVLFKAG